MQEVLGELLLGLLSLGVVYAIYYIYKLTIKVENEASKIADETLQNLVDGVMWDVETLVKNTVTKFEQTVAKELREKVKEGKVDRSELLKIGQMAYDEVYNQLSEDVKDILSLRINDVRQFIVNLVEQEVYELKKNYN